MGLEKINNFASVNFQIQVFKLSKISMKFCFRIISKRKGIRKCNSACQVFR